MQITEIPVPGYERVAKAVDRESGLRAIIAVHDRTLGPALGGMRVWPYETEEVALTDVLRLSRGMTYKSAVARTGLGGGKSVVIADGRSGKSEALFLAMGRFIEAFGGKYITAEDVGTSIPDLEIVRRETKWVTGLSRKAQSSGNPSPYTALGVFQGLHAVIERCFGAASPKGLRFGIQGVGAVGSEVARLLAEAGATVLVRDLDARRAEALATSLGVTSVRDDRVLFESCDVLVPCALGGALNDDTIPQLRCKAVAGAANNQLLEERHGDELARRGILYAPDYVINAGGIINVSVELLPGGYVEKESLRRIAQIPASLKRVFEISEREKIGTHRAADRLAEEILREAAKAKAKAS